MYPAVIALTLAIASAPAGAADAVVPKAPLELRPKAAIAPMTPTHRFAPFV